MTRERSSTCLALADWSCDDGRKRIAGQDTHNILAGILPGMHDALTAVPRREIRPLTISS
jgi:hypothetical protein